MWDDGHKEVRNKLKDIGIDVLENANLLEITTKELIINELIENVQIDDEKSKEIFEEFIESNSLKDENKLEEFLSKDILHSKLIRSNKIKQFFLKNFKSAAKEFFIKNKSAYDKVTYSLIRNSNFQLAKELYLQIEGKEENIYDLATKYSEGDEKLSKGIIGPVPISQSHEIIRQKISSCKEGELLEPFRIDNWWIIFKLEKLFQTTFSNQVEFNICRELFEKSILKTSLIIIKQIRFGSESE